MIRQGVDIVLRVAGVVVAVAASMTAAVVTLVLVPLRLDLGSWQVRIPVAVVLAVAGNVLLLWFARVATGSRWGVVAAVVGWFTVMLPALGATTEGDRLLMPDDWVGTLTLFGGTIALTIGTVLTVAAPRRSPAGSSLGRTPPERSALLRRRPVTMSDHEDSSP